MSSVDVSRTTPARHDLDGGWQLTSSYLLRARKTSDLRGPRRSRAPVVGVMANMKCRIQTSTTAWYHPAPAFRGAAGRRPGQCRPPYPVHRRLRRQCGLDAATLITQPFSWDEFDAIARSVNSLPAPHPMSDTTAYVQSQ